ncbi:H/ACA ribonucleoprotein complex subunit DKC1-like isoform X3 [Eriocheir sinensis]|uniref:H/ACA ribonucleoprotein complex subunit DKC1-like isoform X2 n=1 Tax=Eriocheir sinensis TaxID=95602 RepID=UPI0021C914E0|nr:H/ACA ribonucleoprotein complex subunit DKC1-like isoform X2 [Eriocheir sinensis]XP_050726565.1 H/ACA ribonucleoprotein complex subunit DKC1-like isoform X3 [Eriocheir sinensis]
MKDSTEFLKMEVKEEPVDQQGSSSHLPSSSSAGVDRVRGPSGDVKEEDVWVKDEPIEELDTVNTTTFTPKPESTWTEDSGAQHTPHTAEGSTARLHVAAAALPQEPAADQDNSGSDTDEAGQLEGLAAVGEEKSEESRGEEKMKTLGELQQELDFHIKPSEAKVEALDASHWPLLLKNFDKLSVRTCHFTPLTSGCSPLKRDITEYIKSGFINLDKPANCSAQEVASWVKGILDLGKISHSGTLEPKETGCLIVCLERATQLVMSQQRADKEYVCVFRLQENLSSEESFKLAFDRLKGPQFQRPPLRPYRSFSPALARLKGPQFKRPPWKSAPRSLQVRSVCNLELLEFDAEKNLGVFRVRCEAGTYISALCVHLGMLLGVGAQMQELRKVGSGGWLLCSVSL